MKSILNPDRPQFCEFVIHCPAFSVFFSNFLANLDFIILTLDQNDRVMLQCYNKLPYCYTRGVDSFLNPGVGSSVRGTRGVVRDG